ncbi:MAG: metal-dependent transcriptional regulator [Termitinemataceae bacterium]|nr:MAG: metal-dependent transcriptional regulator [Termitinemataceae bacterium]
MTQSQEDYLEMVSFLSDEGEVRITDIAKRLKISKPAVLTALKSLEEKKLVTHKRYSTVSLTESGKILAAEIRKRHDLLTDFLKNILGVNEKAAEEDACKMEHVLSEETLTQMQSMISQVRSKK